MAKIHTVTQSDIEQALQRVECGESGIDDANLLRARIALLESQVQVLSAGSDDIEFDEMDLPGYCGTCGGLLEAVRPGRWQCNGCGK